MDTLENTTRLIKKVLKDITVEKATLMYRFTTCVLIQKKKEDFNQVQILKPVQVEALTASVVKVRKAVCSSGGEAGLEDLKGRKGEEYKAGD